MKKSILSVVMVVLGVSMGVQALASSPTEQCHSGSGPEQVACLQRFYESAELDLNNAYQAKIAFLQGRQQFDAAQSIFYENLEARLRISQRAWLQDRESQCELESSFKAEVAYLMSSTIECNVRMDIARTQYLKTLTVPVK